MSWKGYDPVNNKHDCVTCSGSKSILNVRIGKKILEQLGWEKHTKLRFYVGEGEDSGWARVDTIDGNRLLCQSGGGIKSLGLRVSRLQNQPTAPFKSTVLEHIAGEDCLSFRLPWADDVEAFNEAHPQRKTPTRLVSNFDEFQKVSAVRTIG